MIYYILGVYAVASVFTFRYVMSPAPENWVTDILYWSIMPCMIVFYMISKIISFPAYLVLFISKLLLMDTHAAADILEKMIED